MHRGRRRWCGASLMHPTMPELGDRGDAKLQDSQNPSRMISTTCAPNLGDRPSQNLPPRGPGYTPTHESALADHPRDPLAPPPRSGAGGEPQRCHRHGPRHVLGRHRSPRRRPHLPPHHRRRDVRRAPQARPVDLPARLRDRRHPPEDHKLQAGFLPHAQQRRRHRPLALLPSPPRQIRRLRALCSASRRPPQARGRQQPPPSCSYAAIHLPHALRGGGRNHRRQSSLA